MPFTGGYSPSPERTGGGDAGSSAPRLQRIFESIAARRGPAFDPTDESIVGAENMALARAIDQDLYGANERLVNEMNPATATVAGLLPRWEVIWGAVPQPGDAESVRQARVAARMLRVGQTADPNSVRTVIRNALGALFVDLTLIGTDNANTWWPGLAGSAAKITNVTSSVVTIAGLLMVPTDAAGKTIVVANANTSANNGTFPILSWVSRTSLTYLNLGTPASPDYGVGGSSGAPTIQWSLANPLQPWTSTLQHVLVEVDPTAVPGYLNPDGTPNGAFYAAVNLVNPILDWLLPADVTFDWYVKSSHGGPGWYLDEPNLDLEIFDS